MLTTLFADVLLPLPVEGYYTYRVPFDLADEVAEGKRVIVQFGKKKIYTGLIRHIHKIPPRVEPKYLLSVLDVLPIVNTLQFRFWEWMASYYCCQVGEVMNAALPSAFKLASETRIILNKAVEIDPSTLSPREYELIIALQGQESLMISEAASAINIIKIFPVIKSLIDKGYIFTEETVSEKFKPRFESFVTLTDTHCNEGKLGELYSQLEKRSEKQLQVLVEYINLSGFLTATRREVARRMLIRRIEGASAALTALVKKGVLSVYEKEVSRFSQVASNRDAGDIQLSEIQQLALSKIHEGFNDKNVVLLHGVTSSGKTELYIRLIQETLEQGKQVLYLLPEIALTTQIIQRLQKYFGSKVGVYHSRFDENERVEIWERCAGTATAEDAGNYQVILGARSAVFLPFSNLGLIVVDEEHDSSFKQYDPAPRYNGRDAAIFLASLHQAKTLLGTATPSVETYFNVLENKYGLSELPERYSGLLLPSVEVVNLRDAHRNKQMKSIFSQTLLDAIQSALEAKEQVILFQNRRGFSLHLLCPACEHVPQCIQCDVSLVYHKKQNQLRCHYCGFSTRIPEQCPHCGSTSIKMMGFGTEQVEEELQVFFPHASIARMDQDSTRNKNAYQKLITDFENRQIDILTGTQMVTKGLDFDNVALVGILNADGIVNFPDFRSFERAFQLMSQVAGRAGRKKKQGRVLIQAFNGTHPVIRYVLEHNYRGMYEQQIAERNLYKYPPFYRLIQLTLRHSNPDKLNKASDILATSLRKVFGKRMLGPEFPYISRIKNLYLKNILFKVEKGADLTFAKKQIMDAIKKLNTQGAYSTVRVQVDVDPV